MIDTIFALFFFLLTLFVVVFQWCVFLKKPWGEYTMGGKFDGILPKPYRIAALIQSFLLLFSGFVVLDYHHLLGIFSQRFLSIWIWFVISLMFLSMIMNLMTKSKKEKRLWGPITVFMFVLVMIIVW